MPIAHERAVIAGDKHKAWAVLAALHWTQSQRFSWPGTEKLIIAQVSSQSLGGRGRGRQCHLVPVEGDGRQGQGGHVEGAVLHKAADVAHGLPKDPRAVHKADLRGKQQLISQKMC